MFQVWIRVLKSGFNSHVAVNFRRGYNFSVDLVNGHCISWMAMVTVIAIFGMLVYAVLYPRSFHRLLLLC